MIVLAGFGNAKADRNDIQEQGLGQVQALRAQIVSRMEAQLKLTRLQGITFEQRSIGPAVSIGFDGFDVFSCGATKPKHFNLQPGGRSAACSV